MSHLKKASTVLTVRMGADLDRSLAREARRRRKTKSAVVREILAAELAGEKDAFRPRGGGSPASVAPRQPTALRA